MKGARPSTPSCNLEVEVNQNVRHVIVAHMDTADEAVEHVIAEQPVLVGVNQSCLVGDVMGELRLFDNNDVAGRSRNGLVCARD